MRIVLARQAGLCFGVRDAIARAEALAAEAPLTILGELVHNPDVQRRLKEKGVRQQAEPHGLGGTRVLITAHGASDRRRRELHAHGLRIADATCPLVRHAHTQLMLLVKAGYFPVVIGQPGHVEVRGLTEDFAEAIVIEAWGDIAKLPQRTRYGIISQTTQPIERVRALVEEIRRFRPNAEVRFVDTVCQPTKDRQRALHELVEEADMIVVVGGRHSNNTRQLVEACRRGGRRALHVESADELDATAFRKTRVVGVTAGTSTLPETLAAVIARLEQIAQGQL